MVEHKSYWHLLHRHLLHFAIGHKV